MQKTHFLLRRNTIDLISNGLLELFLTFPLTTLHVQDEIYLTNFLKNSQNLLHLFLLKTKLKLSMLKQLSINLKQENFKTKVITITDTTTQ